MTSANPVTEKVPVSISDTVSVRIESAYTIETSGFTYSRAAGSRAELLLPEDPNRVRALIQCDTIVFIGSRNQLSSINANVPNAGGNGPGARILNVSPFVELKGTGELWIAYTGATEVGVIVERKVAKGR